MILVAQLALVASGLWHVVQPGVWQRELPMASRGPLSVVRAIVVRLDPAVVRFTLDTATRDERTRGAWTVDRIPPNGVVALNTGQFTAGAPWGWLVRHGIEERSPGAGSVAMSFVVDSGGTPALVDAHELPAVRGHVALAFQSYPALLAGSGELPWELRGSGRGVDLEHRDSRLGIGIAANGSVIIVLTRFTGLGGAAPTLPWGPTVLEMAAFMKSLGCRRAVLLDGGISSQLALRARDGSVQRWTNWRAVPLGMLVLARPEEPKRKAGGG
jgi:hypothetical protein